MYYKNNKNNKINKIKKILIYYNGFFKFGY